MFAFGQAFDKIKSYMSYACEHSEHKLRNTLILLAFLVVVLGIISVVIKPNAAGKNKSTQMENTQKNMELKVEILKEGAGAGVQNGQIVSVHYTGWLDDGLPAQAGTKFDSSLDRGRPFEFTLGAGQVIQGWDLGVLNMKIGEKRRLTIPAGMAYGERGVPEVIPPNATLIFEVELLAIK